MKTLRAIVAPLLLAAMLPFLNGCFAFALAGVMQQNFEYQKLVEVPPRYEGLADKKVAILVDADLSVLYQYPQLVASVTTGVSQRIAANVEGVQVVDPTAILSWQYRTSQWNAMSYGDMMELMGVDRLVVVDIFEYRLHPPGNAWLWEGVAAADIGIAEADGIDPHAFVTMFQVTAAFPDIEGVGLENASETQIQTGLLFDFIKRTAELFYLHTEPKYPDQYRGPE